MERTRKSEVKSEILIRTNDTFVSLCYLRSLTEKRRVCSPGMFATFFIDKRGFTDHSAEVHDLLTRCVTAPVLYTHKLELNYLRS